LCVIAVCAHLVTLGIAGVICAEESTVEKPSAAPEVYAIPEGKPAELLEFIQRLISEEPPEGALADMSEEQQLSATLKIARSVVAAAEKALQSQPSAEEQVEAFYFKFQGLDVLQQLGAPGAEKVLRKAIDAALAHQNPDVAAVGMKFHVESNMSRWPALSSQEKNQLIESLIQHVKTAGVDPSHAQTLMVVTDFLAQADDYPLATRLLDELLPLFRQHKSPRMQGVVPLLEGISRRLALPGKPLKLSGTLLSGRPLDWKEYEGKVVLVDFWATWCGPCRQELPNVLNMYHAYHDQGFDVIGICLDDDPDQARTFIKQKQLPWSTLFSVDESQRGWSDPRAVEFGVTGIPMAILLDRDSKVVSLNARGEELGRLLREMLGAPAESPDADPQEDRVGATAR
jgi:thiol-disulfide isomerase/thioredoxin